MLSVYIVNVYDESASFTCSMLALFQTHHFQRTSMVYGVCHVMAVTM